MIFKNPDDEPVTFGVDVGEGEEVVAVGIICATAMGVSAVVEDDGVDSDSVFFLPRLITSLLRWEAPYVISDFCDRMGSDPLLLAFLRFMGQPVDGVESVFWEIFPLFVFNL